MLLAELLRARPPQPVHIHTLRGYLRTVYMVYPQANSSCTEPVRREIEVLTASETATPDLRARSCEAKRSNTLIEADVS